MMNFFRTSGFFFPVCLEVSPNLIQSVCWAPVCPRKIISPVLKWEKYGSFIYHGIKLSIQVTTGKSMNHLKDSSNFTSIKGIRHPINCYCCEAPGLLDVWMTQLAKPSS